METWDVIIAGGGGAGLIAAMAAAKEGARVLQLEKTAQLGGCWAPGIGNGGTSTGAQTVIQFEAGVFNDSPSLYYADCMWESSARVRNDPATLRFYCERTGAVIDWLDRLGAYQKRGRQPLSGRFGEYWSVPRSYSLNPDFCRLIIEQHQQLVVTGNITVLLNTQVDSLIQEGVCIAGIRASDAAGTRKEYRAPSVIIATGGFASNPELLTTYNLPRAWDAVSVAPEFATGDGLVMCRDTGAQLVNTGYSMAMGTLPRAIPDPQHPGRRLASVNMDGYPGAIWVNRQGRRVINEDCGARNPRVREVKENIPEWMLIVLLDRRLIEANPPIVLGRSWQWFEDAAHEGRLVQRADTIEGLSQLVGIDEKTLTETVARYNQFVDNGVDAEFGRGDLKYQIDSPPFYAIKTAVSVVATSGGPKTNIHQQVLDENGGIISGLYAAGEVTGYQGWGTGMYNMGCFVFGQQAGRMAARHSLYHAAK